MKYSFRFVTYTGNESVWKDVVIEPTSIDDMSISYDGGRFSISINGKEIFKTLAAGNEFSFDITNKNAIPKHDMNKMKYRFTNYTENKEVDKEVVIKPKVVDDISINYDGGRLYISINGQEVFKTLTAGNDFSFDITK